MKNAAAGKNAFVLFQDIKSGKIMKEMDIEEKIRLGKRMKDMSEEEKKQIPNNKKYAQPVRIYQGGKPADSANRKDGMALARVLKISRGSSQPIIISCEEGPGKQLEGGLIVPQWQGKPEKKIIVSMTNDDLKTIALAVPQAYNAWLSAKYSVKLFAEEKERRQNNK